MASCDTCGHTWEPIMQVQIGDTSMQFDCFECAITALAPRCSNCGCIVIGHGVTARANQRPETCCCSGCARSRDRTVEHEAAGQVQLDEALAASFPASDPASVEAPH